MLAESCFVNYSINHHQSKNMYILLIFLQEEQNRGKPNWEHLNDELHVLITVEDSNNRATVKLQRAVEEIKKLLIPVVSILYNVCVTNAINGV